MDKNKLISIACDVCVNKSHENIWIQPPNVVCKKCGFAFINPRPKKKFLNDYYTNNIMSSGSVYCKTEELSRQGKFDTMKINYIFAITKLTGGTVLEIGCRTGNLLRKFNKNKWERYGIEPSKKSFRNIKGNSLHLVNNTLEKARFDYNFFDLVIAASVLEHTFSPKEFVRKIHQYLKKTGFVYILVPNIYDPLFHRSDFDIDEHLSHFSKKSLKNLLEINGFRIINLHESRTDKFIELIAIKSMPIKVNFNKIEYLKSKKFAKKETERVKKEEDRIRLLINTTLEKWQKQNKRIGVYGAGLHSLYLEELTDLSKKGVYYFDSDPVKQKILFLNKKVFPPSKINTLGLSKFIISSESYQEEIYKTIKKYATNSEILKLY